MTKGSLHFPKNTMELRLRFFNGIWFASVKQRTKKRVSLLSESGSGKMEWGTMRAKVLVADDERQVRDLLNKFLTSEGYEVLLASNKEKKRLLS